MDILQSEVLKGLADGIWLLTRAAGFSENLQNDEPAPIVFSLSLPNDFLGLP